MFKEIGFVLILIMFSITAFLAVLGEGASGNTLACIESSALEDVTDIFGNKVYAQGECQVIGISSDVNRLRTALTEDKVLPLKLWDIGSATIGTFISLLSTVLLFFVLLFFGWFAILETLLGWSTAFYPIIFILGSVLSVIQAIAVVEFAREILASVQVR